MRNHVHVQVTGKRTRAGWDGWVEGVEAVVLTGERGVLSDPRSAFFGGQGLLPPFRPRPHHEARAWARVEPGRVLAHGVGPEGPYVALRRLRGVQLSALREARPHDEGFVEAVIAHLATELAALHSAGVVHRALRPSVVLLVEGRARLAGLADAAVDGCAPLRGQGGLGPEADLGALGNLGLWMFGERPSGRSRIGEVLLALTAPDPSARPRSMNEVLVALGREPGPPAAVPAPHPSIVAWPGGAWADRPIAQGNPWELVRRLDATEPDRWALAAAAGRLLRVARGTDAWLTLATLCWMLSERVPEPERGAYRLQAEEARVRARAPWHAASRSITSLLAAGESVTALSETSQHRRAERRARADGGGGALALVGFHARNVALVDEGLSEAGPEDLDAVRVAASRLLRAAPREAPMSAARLSLPSAQLDAVRALCADGAEEEASRLATAFPEPVATRARLIVSLSVGDRSEALGAARALAMRGVWDDAVAATLLAHSTESDPLRAHARVILRNLAAREDAPGLRAAAGEAVAAQPSDLVAWSGLLCGRVAAGEIDRAAAELERAGSASGPEPWRLFALELAASGRTEDARAALLAALRRHPNDAALAALDAALGLLDGAPEQARSAAEHALAQEPKAPWGWLARAACALWVGDTNAAARDLDAAARAGARGRSVEALAGCLPPGEA